MLDTKNLFAKSPLIILSFLILSFVFDFIDKIDIFYGFGFIKFNRILKGLFLIYSVSFLSIRFKYVFSNFKYLLGVIAILSSLFLLKFNFSSLYINEYIRYMFGIIILPLIYSSFSGAKKDVLYKLYKLTRLLILINGPLILLALIFDIRVFRTYDSYGRFGYNGFILSQGFTPYVYMYATTLFWVFKDKKMLVLTLLLSLLSGVKGVYFAESVLLVLFVFFDQKYNTMLKLKVVALTAIISAIVISVFFMQPLFKEIIASEGLLTAVFSYRLEHALKLFTSLNTENYSVFIGAINLDVIRLELQLLDIILFFGCLGLVFLVLFVFCFGCSLLL